MNKPIIIDGVDVSECEYLWKDNSVIDLHFCRINFDNNYFSNGIPCSDKCNKHSDCYYKQLQRLKAENEKLKEENIEIKEDEIMQRIINIELMQKWDENSEDYKKRVLEYMKKMRY